jgi:hypothetical protein
MTYTVERVTFTPYVVIGRPPSEERSAMRGLDVGESFLIDDERRAMHARQIACKLKPMKFSVIKSREGWRVWRTA